MHIENEASLAVTQVSVRRPVPPPFTPPLASTADRRIVVPRRGSTRGALVTRGPRARVVTFESQVERRVLLCLLARRDITEVREQVGPVEYRDQNGEIRRHTFDFWVRRSDGRKTLIAVKPSRLAERDDLAGLLRIISRYVPRSLADNVVAMTELDAPRDRVRDAELIHSIRDSGAPEHEGAIADLVAGLNGITTIESLIAASGLAAEGFRGVVKLIDAGALRVIGNGPIRYGSRVARSMEGGEP